MSGFDKRSTKNISTGRRLSGSPWGVAVAAPPASPTEELRARNITHSPLLRLPYEALVRILLFAMGDTKRTPAWTTILPTCHHLCQTILSTPGLWGRVYCFPPEKLVKRFEMAAWSPTEIYAHLFMESGGKKVKAALDSVRSGCRLSRDRIHTLEFCGKVDVWPHFSWIFDEPFPNLKHLSISFVMSPNLVVPLVASIGSHLETLSIDNVKIPVSSHLFCNLKNLHVGFSQKRNVRPLAMHQLITMLNSSPCLETLSLSQIRPKALGSDDGQPRRIATLSHLKSFKLKDRTSEAVSILDRLNLPAIVSLTLDLSEFVPSDILLLLRNDSLADRLFNDTPRNTPHYTPEAVRMGGLELEHGLTGEWEEVFLLVHMMAPLSVTKLEIIQDRFDECHWREFARLHPEVRSVSSSHRAKDYRSIGLWRALLPNYRDRSATLFPKLEFVVLKAEHLSMIPLLALECLRMRSEAGFKLKRLEVHDTGKLRQVGRQPEVFGSFADIFVYCEAPIEL